MMKITLHNYLGLCQTLSSFSIDPNILLYMNILVVCQLLIIYPGVDDLFAFESLRRVW